MQEFSLMKKTSILLNASRGGIVDEHALSQAIQDKKIKGAAIDVFTSEPPEKNNPLLNLPDEFRDNIILTPHIGGITAQSWSELFSRSWINIQKFFDGEELEKHSNFGIFIFLSISSKSDLISDVKITPSERAKEIL